MEMKTKIETVAVVFGGRSGEHEVSIITAHQVMDALEVAGYSLLPIYISKDGEWFAGQKLNNLKLFTGKDLNLNKLDEVWKVSLSPDRSIRTLLLHPEGKRGLFRKPPQLWADVFFPTIHGSFGEDGTLQGLFELADVPYVGSNVLASAVGMDKSKMKDFSRAAGIPILECITLSRNEFQRDPQTNLGRLESFCKYPLMVKPLRLGSSIGVRKEIKRRPPLAKKAGWLRPKELYPPLFPPLRASAFKILPSRRFGPSVLRASPDWIF
jgi:D-alanine-D-alanine ligase